MNDECRACIHYLDHPDRHAVQPELRGSQAICGAAITPFNASAAILTRVTADAAALGYTYGHRDRGSSCFTDTCAPASPDDTLTAVVPPCAHAVHN